MQTPFELLAVSEHASDEEIKSAYLKKIRAYPPERHPETFKQIREAYEQVSTLRRRVAYRLFHCETPGVEELRDALKTSNNRRIETGTLLQLLTQAARHHLKAQTKTLDQELA